MTRAVSLSLGMAGMAALASSLLTMPSRNAAAGSGQVCGSGRGFPHPGRRRRPLTALPASVTAKRSRPGRAE